MENHRFAMMHFSMLKKVILLPLILLWGCTFPFLRKELEANYLILSDESNIKIREKAEKVEFCENGWGYWPGKFQNGINKTFDLISNVQGKIYKKVEVNRNLCFQVSFPVENNGK
ncbi:hypothetical protein [Leptospira santarosai]|nr:hypothetical protein [Leptospira santarosai]MDI7230414.1 hypothetical protein [Leptospira santarosai]